MATARKKLPPLKWGEWELDAERLVLMHVAGYGYEVDLEDCTTSAQVLDWIAQIQGKVWGTRKTVGQLVEALCDLLDPQATLCSMGQHLTITRERVGQLVAENELKVRAQREMKRLEAAGDVPWIKEVTFGGGLKLRTMGGGWITEETRLIEHYRTLRDGKAAKRTLPKQRLTFRLVEDAEEQR